VLILLLRGKILPATLFKLVRVVKLRLEIGDWCRQSRNSKCDQEWTLKDLRVFGRPFEGEKQCLDPGFFLAGLYPPRIPPLARPRAIPVKKRVPGCQKASVHAYPYCGGGHCIPILYEDPPQRLDSKAWVRNGTSAVTHLHSSFEVCQQLGP